jgi:hypothetical protein
LQKANYDASVGPFDTNVFTDVLLVMEQYPEEFPELGDPSGSLLDAQLASTFRKLTGHTLLSPCDEPYAHAPRDASYYDDHRADLIRFARTVFYKMTSDFDFATRAHTLLVKHYFDRYEQVLAGAKDGLSRDAS